MKHLIITGAYGLLGTNLSKVEGYKITHIKCDELPENLEPADLIIHGAGYGQPEKFLQDKIKTISVNTTTTIELLKKLKPDGKFLFLSTSEVYSGNTPPYKEEDIGTTSPSHPRACYIESKRCGEAICHAWREKGYDVKIARVSLVYGFPYKPSDSRVIYQFIEQGLGGKITLKDSGTAMRTYCFIDDAVEMLWNILLHGTQVVYNVGGFSTISISGLAGKIAKILEAEVYIPEQGKSIEGAPQDVVMDLSRVLNEFIYKDFITLDEGLKRTIEWRKSLS